MSRSYSGRTRSSRATTRRRCCRRATARTVEIFLRGVRIDVYARSYERGRHTTRPEHMPKAHQAHAEWSPSRLIGWAKTIGADTAVLVEAIMSERRHPEQGYRSCL